MSNSRFPLDFAWPRPKEVFALVCVRFGPMGRSWENYAEDYSLGAFYLAGESERIMAIFDRYLPMRFHKISSPRAVDVINLREFTTSINQTRSVRRLYRNHLL